MQGLNLSQVILRFFDAVPYGVELIPECNLARTVQRGFKALDAISRASSKGISPLYFFADRHWFSPDQASTLISKFELAKRDEMTMSPSYRAMCDENH
jgi:hypothetical protein